VLGPDPGFRAGAEKPFQAIVAKALDHGAVYRVAIRGAMPAWVPPISEDAGPFGPRHLHLKSAVRSRATALTVPGCRRFNEVCLLDLDQARTSAIKSRQAAK